MWSRVERWAWAFAAIALAVSCHSGTPLAKTEPARLVATPAHLVLPDTVVGQTSRGAVLVVNQGSAPGALSLQLESPFFAAPSSSRLMRGEEQLVEVTFAPTGAGRFVTELTGDLSLVVEGTALAAPACEVPRVCVTSAYDLAAGLCRESPAPEGTPCETRCVSGGCRAGLCLGAPANCDDDDACTIDGCNEDTGCRHEPRVCPATACQVARCDPATGCNTDPAPDGTPCGPEDCDQSLLDVCLGGQCVPRQRPSLSRCTNRWVPVSIPSRSFSAMAFDEHRRRVVLFAGQTSFRYGQGVLADTWEYDGRWRQRTPARSPPGRSAHAMAFDARRQRVVLFGGRDGFGLGLGDTWEWDGLKWVERSSPASPPPRRGHAMVYVPTRQRVMLMGGWSVGRHLPLDDTWEWDGNAWQEVTSLRRPPPRSGHAMAWDAARQRVVLYGGHDESASRRDTWEWDGTDWALRASPTTAGFRSFHAMAFDASRQRVILWGGLDWPRFDSAELVTWEWDGATWTRIRASGPAVEEGHAMAGAEPGRGIVLFGGNSRAWGWEQSAETWLWNGSTWTRGQEAAKPPTRQLASASWDPVRQEVLLFGGANAASVLGDLWTWDGMSWNEQPAAGGPSPRSGAALTWDFARQRHVLFGGNAGSGVVQALGDTWERQGTTWTLMTPPRSPSPRHHARMVFDRARNVVLLVGGYTPQGWLPETWTWDGVTWTEVPDAGTPLHLTNGPSLAWDETHAEAVLYGGENGQPSTWTWDGARWLHRATSGPGWRMGAELAWDPSSRRVVLINGHTVQFPQQAAFWEWDGAQWRERHLNAPPPGSAHDAVAWDGVRQQLMLVQYDTTWLFAPY